MKHLLITALLGIGATAFAQEKEYLCFKNDKNPAMEIQLYLKGGSPQEGGNVRYKKYKNNPIRVEYADFSGGSNSVGHIFNEVINGKVTGQYELWSTFKGAGDSYELNYTNNKTGKSYYFTLKREQSKPCF